MNKSTSNPHEHDVDDNATIWRYMREDRFQQLLDSRNLCFSSLNKLDDPFEGHLPERDEAILKIIESEDAKTKKDYYTDPFEIRKIRQEIASIRVNCWSMRASESAVMWRLYAWPRGVAIKSTIGKLRQVLVNTRIKIDIGKIHYINSYKLRKIFGPKHHPILDPVEYALHKRADFRYEREIRAYLTLDPTAPPQFLNVDLKKLCDCIYVTPTPGSELMDELRSLLDESKLQSLNLRESRMFQVPIDHSSYNR